MSSPESFTVEELVRHVEKFYGISDASPDIFEEFRREVLRRYSESNTNFHAPPFGFPQLNGELCHQPVPATNDFVVRPRLPNEYPYHFGNVMKSNWYRKFLHPDVRQKTYRRLSTTRWSDFRSYFRLTLEKVDDLTNMFLDRGWCTPSKRDWDETFFYVKTELRILGALNVLGNHTPFRQLTTNMELSAEDHQLFFHKFIKKLSSVKSEFIKYPETFEELKVVMKKYSAKKLPGCAGSIDVVHLKWSNCPAGDYNRSLGKEGYPTLAFKVVTGNDRDILGISPIQFGT